MWLFKTTILIVLISSIKAIKNEHLALKEMHHEIARISERANNYYLETEVHSDKFYPIEFAEKILDKKLDFGGLEEYGKMDISEGMEGQKKLLDLVKEEKNSGYSEEIVDKVLEGFEKLDGFDDLRNKLVALNSNDVEKKIETLQRSGLEREKIDKKQLDYNVDRVRAKAKWIFAILGPVLPSDKSLTNNDKKYIHDAMIRDELLPTADKALVAIRALREMFTNGGFLKEEDIYDPLNEVIESTKTVSSRVNDIKKWKELIPSLEQVEKALNRHTMLKTIAESPNIKGIFENLKKDFEQLKDFSVHQNEYKKYQGIQSLQTLIKRIKAVSNYLKIGELKMLKLSETWKPLELYFENLKIADQSVISKIETLRGCLQKVFLPTEISKEEFENLVKPIDDIRALNTELRQSLSMLFTFHDLPQIDRLRKIKGPEDIDNSILEDLQILKDEARKVYEFFIEGDSVHGYDTTFFEIASNQLIKKLKSLDTVKTQAFAENRIGQLTGIKELLVCYDGLKVTKPKMQEVLNSSKDKWNFDPKVLESTVEVIGMFKEANQMVEELKRWKPEGEPDIKDFPLKGEDVKILEDGKDAFKSLLDIQKGWESLKTLKIQNPDWEFLNSSITKFFEDSSSSDFFFKTPFPANLPLGSVKKFIEEDYEGNQKTEILNLLEEIEQLSLQYPTADMMKNLNEMMEKMKKWEEKRKPKVEKDLTFVDCSENPCDVTLKLPEVGPDAPVKEVVLEDDNKKIL